MKGLVKYTFPRYNVIVFLAILLPLVLSLVLILSINLTFWFDNTRDLLSAWNNIDKLTLIGPPSGIPGLFYGPYWIWLLSFGLLFSKNPLIVTIITATIPYFVLFPLVWFSFNKFFDKTSLILGWLLFMFNSGMTYATQLWNIYPAPLITITIIYLLLVSEFTVITKKQSLISLTTGFLIGLLINFHISFGIAFFFGSAIFLIIDTIQALFQNKKKTIQKIILYKLYSLASISIGFLVSFLPTLLFEVRHGFHQTQTLIHTLFKYGDVVTVTGLNKTQILLMFITTFGNLLHIPTFYAGSVLLLLIATLIFVTVKRKITLKTSDVKILLLISSLFAGTLFIYLTAKNPVWEYHFTSVDVLYLVFLTFFATKLSLFRKGLVLLTIVVVFISFATFVIYFHRHTSHFEQQEDVVKIISADAKKTDYTVYAYNPAIYSYDFSYLFKWMVNKEVPYDPGMITQTANTMYLIVPKRNDARVQDFIQFRSQPKVYKEVKTWTTETDFAILKFIKR